MFNRYNTLKKKQFLPPKKYETNTKKTTSAHGIRPRHSKAQQLLLNLFGCHGHLPGILGAHLVGGADLGAPMELRMSALKKSLSEKVLVEEILVKHTFTCEKHKF